MSRSSNTVSAEIESLQSISRQATPHLQQGSWFAIWTRSRHEPVVCRELADRNIQTFLPTVMHISKWKDRKKRILWPLFPGYCFARFDSPSLLTVLKCQGVVTVLSTGIHPIAIPDIEIEALQTLVASGVSYDPCAQLTTGTMVRVVSGPLCGIVGRVERRAHEDHLILAVDLLNCGARIQIADWDLQPL
jgi:transcription termination/antitermination protein NusG